MKARLSVFCFFFILHPSAFILAFGGRCGSRTHRSVQAPTVFGTARRAVAQPSNALARAPGFEPRNAGLESASLTFSLRPLDASGRTRTSTLASASRSFTGCCRAVSASDARNLFRRRRNRKEKKLTKAVGAAARLTNPRRRAPANETRAHATNVAAHARGGLLPSSPQVTSVVKQRKEGARWLPHRKQARSDQVSTNFLEIWEREAAPAELTLIPATILKRHAFGSERVPLNKSAAVYGG